MKKIFQTKKARLTPVIMTAAFALASLKAAGVWVSFASANAEEAIAPASVSIDAAETKPSVVSERLLEQLAARKEELDAREAELDTRESVIEAAELRLDASMKSLQQEKDAIAAAETSRKREQAGEIGRLSDAYERMKPRDAARVFEVLDNDILIPVAAGMRTQSLALVLAEMSADRAKYLTTALANREGESEPAHGAVQ